MHLRPTALSEAEDLRPAEGRSMHTMSVSRPSNFLNDRPAGSGSTGQFPAFHIFHLRPSRNKKKVGVPYLSSKATLHHCFTDSDATRRDRSVNDASLPGIKTNASTTPLHLTRSSNSPGLKHVESLLDEPHRQVILSSHVRPFPLSVKVPVPARSLLPRSRHHPSPSIPQTKTKTHPRSSLRNRMYTLSHLPLSLMCNHFKTVPITLSPIPRIPIIDPITIKSTPLVHTTTKTRTKQQQRHPSLSVPRRWFHLYHCSSQPSQIPPPPRWFLTTTYRMNP